MSNIETEKMHMRSNPILKIIALPSFSSPSQRRRRILLSPSSSPPLLLLCRLLLLMLLLLLLQTSSTVSQELTTASPTTTSSPSSSSTTSTTTTSAWEPICPPSHTGGISSPDCTHYVVCTDGAMSTSSIMECASGTLYSVELGNCDWEQNVICNPAAEASSSSTTATTTPTPASDADGTDNDSTEDAASSSTSSSPTPPPPEPTVSPTTYAPQTTRPPSSNVGVEDALFYAARDMNTKLFVVQSAGGGGGGGENSNDKDVGGGGGGSVEEGWIPSKLYRFHGFLKGLRMAYMEGVGNMTFYLGTDDDNDDGITSNEEEGIVVGLVNIAAFLAQSMKETIKYDACDENNWDIIDGKYPLSNACGQLGQSYQDYNCPEEYMHMQCQVDPNMEIKATTQASWYGAPGPLFCGPTSVYPTTGYWDYTYMCDFSWEDPPRYCTDYVGQKGGRYDNSEVVMNRNNRTDVMGCCWWGRGVIQTTGVCNFGMLNYFIGKRAADEGRSSSYPDIDFCKDPGAVCSRKDHPELKWIAGMFYWIRSVQTYDSGGWNYIDNLKAFVQGGLTDDSFIDSVSGIVNRGCHNPPCDNGSGALDGGYERKENFKKALEILLEPDGTPRVYRSPEPTKYPISMSPVMSSDYDDNEAWVNDAWISDDEWPSTGAEEGGQEDWSETSNSVENEEEDWSETSQSSGLNLWCGDTLDNAIENCGRNGYDCPDGICVNDLKCFTVGDLCGDGVGTELPLPQGSTTPSMVPGVLTLVPSSKASDGPSQSTSSAAEPSTSVNNVASPSVAPGILTLVPTSVVNDGSSQFPSSAVEPDTSVNNFGLIGQYCASTLAALETECVTAMTCEKSDDCPSGSYCWGERVCGDTNTTTTPTTSATSVLTPSPTPTGLSYSPSLIGSGFANEQLPNPNATVESDITGIFVCGTDFVHASTNCHKPCPSGSYNECDEGEACFENISCEVESTPSFLPQSDAATQPTYEVTNSQPPSILVSDLPAEQFFCASTIQELETSCSTAQSCANGPCPTGVFCFPFTCTTAIVTVNPSAFDSSVSQGPTSNEPTVAPVQVTGLCPPSPFAGWHTSPDCKEYFQCDNGAMGVVFVCGASLKFDKVRNECHPEEYVNSFCYGPPKGEEPNASNALCADGYVGWESSNNCQEYFWCDRGHFDVVYNCPDGQLFNEVVGHCDIANQVTCMDDSSGGTTNISSAPIPTPAKNFSIGNVTGVNGGVVGSFNWTDTPKASTTQNASSDTPPWLLNTIVRTNSSGCILGIRKIWQLVGSSLLLVHLFWSR